MDKLWKKISGFVFASIMAVTLNGKVNAADSEEAELPEPAPTAVVESAPAAPSVPTATAAPAATSPSHGHSSPSAPVATQSESAPAAPSNNSGSSSGETRPAESSAAPAQTQPAAPVQESAPAAPVTSAPAQAPATAETPSDSPSAAPSSAESAPAPQDAPAETAPAAPVTDEAASVVEAVPADAVPVVETTVESAPAEASLVEDVPAEAAPVEEASVEPAPAEETPAAEATPEEEISAGEASVETAAVNETAPAAAATDEPEPDDETASVVELIDVEAAPVEAEPAAEEAEETLEEAEETMAEESVEEEAPAEEPLSEAAPAPRFMLRAGSRSLSLMSLSSTTDESTDNVINLVTDPTTEITSDTAITIKTSGLQHLTSLTSDGDVSIIGTGILLVDEVDLLKDCRVYLQSIKKIYGENGGTVALFVRSTDENGNPVLDSDNNVVYTLINSTVDENSAEIIPAILDEEYEIPSGVSLVVPDGGELVMQSMNMLVETCSGENGEEITSVTYYTKADSSTSSGIGDGVIAMERLHNCPTLTVSPGAALVIETGASFLLNAAVEAGLTIYAPHLVVNGLFSLFGTARGGDVQVGVTGDVTGTGVIEDAVSVTVDGGRETALTRLNLSNTRLLLNELGVGRIGSLNLSGNVTLRYDADAFVNEITMSDGSLTIINKDLQDSNTLSVGESFTGANSTVRIRSGRVLLPSADAMTLPSHNEINYNNGTSWVLLGCAVTEEDGTLQYSGDGFESAPVVPLVGSACISGVTRRIPVASGNYRIHIVPALGWCSYSEYEYGTITSAQDADGNSIYFDCGQNSTISYSVLSEALGINYPVMMGDQEPRYENYTYLLVTCVDGAYDYVLLSPSKEQAVNASDVVQICRMYTFFISDPMGGSSATATNTTYTGSGVLGGSGAGSVSGGTRRFALSGSRSPAPDPDPDPDPEPVPVPDPDPAPDPAPTPEPSPAPQEETVVAAPAAEELRVWEETAAEDSHFLHIELNGEPVTRLEKPVKVRMKFTPAADEADKPLFVVFRDENGALVAFEAYYDAASGELVFSSDMAGIFVVLSFEFDGELFSEEFYAALAALAEIKNFPA